MKTLFQWLLILLMMTTGRASMAQLMNTGVGAGYGKNLTDHMLIKLSDQYLHGLPDEEVEGSRFLDDNFTVANVYSTKGVFSGIPMRYDIFNDYFEFKQDGKIYILDPADGIRKVKLGSDAFVVESYETKGVAKRGYFQLADSGKVQLLAKHTMTFREAREPQALESAPRPAKYTRTGEDLYLKINQEPVEKIASIKRLIELLPDKQDEVKAYAKEHKVSIGKLDEVARLVKFYNSL